IRPQDALNHPTWSMGSKITIDSATLMNKALEIVEAVHLFNVPVSDIEVLVHPQSIVHSMVGFSDGSVMAQMGMPDMKAAISYALSWPERLDLKLEFPDFAALGSLFFEQPDKDRFPSLDFAVKACMEGGTLPAVMNAANEIAVDAFLNHRIDFPTIFTIIEETMNMHSKIDSSIHRDIAHRSGANKEIMDSKYKKTDNGDGFRPQNYTLDDVVKSDAWARKTALDLIKSFR
ncbi:MAG: hypothetical protein HQK61_00795, partial [Desulfamplus sp.]|nr:hypothetical protein [Desulfamplus sp.]